MKRDCSALTIITIATVIGITVSANSANEELESRIRHGTKR